MGCSCKPEVIEEEKQNQEHVSDIKNIKENSEQEVNKKKEINNNIKKNAENIIKIEELKGKSPKISGENINNNKEISINNNLKVNENTNNFKNISNNNILNHIFDSVKTNISYNNQNNNNNNINIIKENSGNNNKNNKFINSNNECKSISINYSNPNNNNNNTNSNNNINYNNKNFFNANNCGINYNNNNFINYINSNNNAIINYSFPNNNNINYSNNINFNNNINSNYINNNNIMNYNNNNINFNNNIITNNVLNNNLNPKIIIENVNLEDSNNLEKEETIIRGLNNIGATCYMNSTLQSLSNTNELTQYFLYKYEFNPNSNEKKMSNEYYKLIKNLWNKDNNKKPFSPYEFKETLSELNPLFKGIAANDSKDLVNFLLQRIHSELNVIKNENNPNNIDFNNSNNEQINRDIVLQKFLIEYAVNYNSIISDLFYGIFETRSQCFGCQCIKYNFQVFNFIEFPLEKVNQYCFNTGKRNYFNIFQNSNVNPDINIHECFEYYSIIETMNGDNQMYCNFCKRNMDSLYRSVLYSLPKILIINLNRGRGATYQCNVNFTEELDLFNYISNKSGNYLYELYAIICHIGPNSMSGHFVAYCKNRMDKNWYLYNDGIVTKCKNYFEYRGKMPYILFYKVKENN